MRGAPAPSAEEQAPDIAVERLGEYLRRLEALGFSGAAIVEHRGEVVLRAGYGWADRETRRPYTPETVQSHGSITKQMTAAAVLLLESRGALALDDPIPRFFAGVPADKQAVTLHQLLTHTAGFPGAIGRDAEPIGPEEFLARALATPLEFPPGEGWGYSNVGYSLLGIVVEEVSGRPYEAFLREELLLPAGLADTGYLLPAWEDDRLATGYLDGARWGRVLGREWRPDGPGWNLRANGGVHTTVDDMHRWLGVVKGGGPLPAAAVGRWTAAQAEIEEGYAYGYGWGIEETPVGPMIAHNGGNGVFSADFVWLPEAELFLYVQGNSSIVYAAGLRDGLLGALFDPGFVLPPAVAVDPGADPAAAAARARA